MTSTEAKENAEGIEDSNSIEPAEAIGDMEPGDALRFHIGKVLEAIEASTTSQSGKPAAAPPRMLQVHLPRDAQQVLVFVIAGSADPTADLDLEQSELVDKDARVRIVEQQGENNTSTVLVIDQWGGTKHSSEANVSSETQNTEKDAVVINLSNQGGKLPMETNETPSDSEDQFEEVVSDEEWSPGEAGFENSDGGYSNDGDIVSSSRVGKRKLAGQKSNESPSKRQQISRSPVTCNKCGMQFASDSAFNFHPCEQETEDSHFICKFCGEKYNDQAEFWEHYRSHVGIKRAQPNKCADCLRIFSTAELLQEHCVETNHVSHVQCTLCEEKFSSRNQLRRHKRITHLQKHACQKCKEVFATKEELTTHREAAHSVTHQCRFCVETFTDRPSLLKHMGEAHSPQMHTCVFCEKMFMKKSSLKAHEAQHIGQGESGTTVKAEVLSDAEEEETEENDDNVEGISYVCEKCGHAFKSERTLQKHMLSHSQRLFPCSKCSIVMRTQEDLSRHEQRHEAKLICEQCGRQYVQMRDLRKHMTTHLDERPFPCLICGFRFFTEDRLRNHQRIHEEKRFLCNLCPMKFTDNEHLRRHLKSHASTNRQRINACVFHCLMCPETFDSPTRLIQHYDTSHPLAEFRCVECDTRVASFNLLKIHFRAQHLGKVIHCCRVCGDAFDNKPTLETHRTNNHNVPRRQQIIADTTITCTACEKSFNSSKLFQNHLTDIKCKEAAAAVNKDTESTPFKCATCQEEFPTNSHLVTHNAAHGTKFPFSCHICGASLADSAEITDHLNQHIAIGVWSCIKCNRTLSTRQSLRMHMAGHGVVAPFSCPTCHKTFNWRSALAWHMNVHTGEQPFRCKRCDASFKQPNQLKAHLLAHDGRKMYECSECNKTFWLRSALLAHLSNHLTDQGEPRPAPTYDCTYCGKVFNAKSYLSNHLRTHKGEKGLLKKLFGCERCKRTFTTRAHLIIHEQTHDGAGLVCPVCQRKFKTLNWLQIHMRIHTAESPVCPICNKSFTIQRSLEEHMAFHDEQNVDITCPTCNTKFRSQRSYLRHKGQCHEGFNGQVCRICGLGFTTVEKYNEHVQVCNIQQNRRTTVNLASSSSPPVVKSEEIGEEEMGTQEPHVVLVTSDETITVTEEIPQVQGSEVITADPNQLIFQNVLETIEGERYVISNQEGAAELEQLIEGQVPTELILDGPDGKVRVQLVFQTTA